MATPRRLLHRALDGLGEGQVTLAEGATATVHGDGLPRVRIDVRRATFYRRILLGGTLVAAESCIDGDFDKLVSVQMLFAMPGYRGPMRLPAEGDAR